MGVEQRHPLNQTRDVTRDVTVTHTARVSHGTSNLGALPESFAVSPVLRRREHARTHPGRREDGQ